jgi:hypothetical protein
MWSIAMLCAQLLSEDRHTAPTIPARPTLRKEDDLIDTVGMFARDLVKTGVPTG